MNEMEKYWFLKSMEYEAEIKRLRNILASDYHTQKDLDRAKHMGDLEAKVKRLRETVRQMQLDAEDKNRQVQATGLIVNCTGCEGGGPREKERLNEDVVQHVERIAKRLRAWWSGENYRQARAASRDGQSRTGRGE